MNVLDLAPLPESLAAFTREEMHRLSVPGVAVGVVHDDVVRAGGFGVTNVRHPLPVTPETIFQIGSTSKTFTATVAMMLVAEGRLELDAPVRRYLPAFRTSSATESARVTLRHLLTHRTGWPGDYFKDFGRGDDSLARYVDNMARAPQLLEAGAAFSYCNSAFYLLARVIEVVAGVPFEDIVRRRLLEPLGLALTGYHPEETLGHRVASGHIVGADGPQVARPWQMARCLNGGGGIASTAIDQLRYALFHIDPSGIAAPPLDPTSVRRMQEPQAEAGSMCDDYGLGWMLTDHAGHRLVKHGGATNGFLSSFELYPDERFGCTVLTNSDTGRELRDTVAAAARRHFLGLADLRHVEVEVPAAALSEYAGTYRAMLATSEVRLGNGALELLARQAPRDMRQPSLPEPPIPLAFIGIDRAIVRDGSHRGERCEFVRDEGGRIAWLRFDGRLARRQ